MVDQIRVSITLKYVALVGGILATLGMSALYLAIVATHPIDWENEISPIAEILSTGILLTTLVYAAVNVNLIAHHQNEQLQREKLKYSAEFVKTWYQPEMTAANAKTRRCIRDYAEGEPNKLLESITKDLDANIAVTQVVNFFEQMAHAVKFNLADEEYLRSFFFTIARQRWHILKPLIDQKRQLDQSDGFLCEFEAMTRRWTGVTRGEIGQ